MDIRSRILTIADRCVLCGICLPHCPTYRLALEEAESPRGRIVLAQALASGRVEAGETLAAHIDHCLGCRACESVCPSGVAYGTLLRDTRELLAEGRPPPWYARLGIELLAQPAGRRLLATAAAWQRHQQPITPGRSGLLERAAARLPPPRPAGSNRTAPAPSPRGRVALFVGCTGELFDLEAFTATERLLRRAGFEVITAPRQGCCGALDAGAGAGERARQRARANLEAFAGEQIDAIIAIASGCAATLLDYPALAGAALPAPVQEATGFLARTLPADLPWRPLPRRVAIHEPCSERRVLKAAGASARLLRRIPGIDLLELPENDRCCGAGGSHMLTQPALADALVEPKAAAAVRLGAEFLVSGNVGCALHLRASLPPQPAIEVLHPVALLARQLPD